MKTKLTLLFLMLSFSATAQQSLPNFREPETGGRIDYRSPTGTFLGSSINQSGRTIHRDSLGRTIYITRCSGSRCVMTDPSGRTVQTFSKDSR